MSREQIMREAVNQAHKLGLKVYGGTLAAVVQQKDGSWTTNPDTGAGDEAGVEVVYTYDWPSRQIRARLTEETMPDDATVPYVLEMIQVMCRHYPTLGAPK